MKQRNTITPQYSGYPLKDSSRKRESEKPDAIVLLLADPVKSLTEKVKAMADNPAAWDHSWFHHYE